MTTNDAQCVQDLDQIVEIFFFKFTELQVETHKLVHRIHDGPLAGERLCRYIEALTLLRYHGVYVTPVLFDSRFCLNCREY